VWQRYFAHGGQIGACSGVWRRCTPQTSTSKPVTVPGGVADQKRALPNLQRYLAALQNKNEHIQTRNGAWRRYIAEVEHNLACSGVRQRYFLVF